MWGKWYKMVEFWCVSWSGIGLISKYVDASIDIPDTTITMPLLWPYTDKSASLRLGVEPEVWYEGKSYEDIVRKAVSDRKSVV